MSGTEGPGVGGWDVTTTTDDPIVEPPSARAWRHSPAFRLVEWVLIIAVSIGTAMMIRTYVAQTFFIPTASMSPTLRIDDRIAIDKLSYRFRDPRRGEIIVFRGPERTQLAGIDLVKRIIALPGEKVSSANGRILVDGVPVDEPYLPKGAAGRNVAFLPFEVPKGKYFVMGDNRMVSNDSRIFGAIERDEIIGRAMIRIWPISRLGNL